MCTRLILSPLDGLSLLHVTLANWLLCFEAVCWGSGSPGARCCTDVYVEKMGLLLSWSVYSFNVVGRLWFTEEAPKAVTFRSVMCEMPVDGGFQCLGAGEVPASTSCLVVTLLWQWLRPHAGHGRGASLVGGEENGLLWRKAEGVEFD